MRISIALCTFNGEHYLQDQLDSIAEQERLPDELIVCDDVSSDATIDILQTFARTAPFRVEIEQNPRNLGSTQNFARAIGKCTGDMIALCDQDDYWHPEKLKLLESALEAQPEKGLVFSDAALVDDQLRPLKKTMWEDVGLTPAFQARIQTDAALSMLLKRRYVTGATMAFRSSFRDVVLPISSNWVHDGWITINIAAHSTFALVPRTLIQYRQHARNQIGTMYTRKHKIRRMWDLVHAQPHTYQREYSAYVDLLNHMTEHLDSERAPDVLQQVQDKVQHWQIRASIDCPRAQRLQQILGELRNGRYQRYSVHGVWSAMRDLFYFGG